MRTASAAFALFRRVGPAGRVEYLAQWNRHWVAFNLVGGKLDDGESFRDACAREVAEELGLLDGLDCVTAKEALCRVREVRHSERHRVDTAYTIEVFAAEFLGDAAAFVATDGDNRWLDADEVAAGVCRDGRAVSDLLRQVVARLSEPGGPPPPCGG